PRDRPISSSRRRTVAPSYPCLANEVRAPARISPRRAWSWSGLTLGTSLIVAAGPDGCNPYVRHGVRQLLQTTCNTGHSPPASLLARDLQGSGLRRARRLTQADGRG